MDKRRRRCLPRSRTSPSLPRTTRGQQQQQDKPMTILEYSQRFRPDLYSEFEAWLTDG